MAGSRNQKQTSYKKNTEERSGKGKQTSKKQQQEEVSYASEIAVWIICAVMLIVELGNFGLCGFINNISKFFFGIFGVIEYVLPLVVMFAAFFLHINDYKKRAVQKVVFGSCVLLCVGMMGQMFEGIDAFALQDWFLTGFEDKTGGGALCGSLAWLLNTIVGRVGTYIIIVLAIILCVVLFAEISVIDFFKEIAAAIAQQDASEDESWEEEELEAEKPVRKQASPAGKQVSSAKQQTGSARKRQRRADDYDEIVKEDYPEGRETASSRKKKGSLLDAISVLPADTDQGILPPEPAKKIPDQEEIHEIKMEFPLNLPGENMGSFDRTGRAQETGKKESAKRKQKTEAKKPIVPTVLPVEDDSAISKPGVFGERQAVWQQDTGFVPETDGFDVPEAVDESGGGGVPTALNEAETIALEQPSGRTKQSASEKKNAGKAVSMAAREKKTEQASVEMENRTAEAVKNVAAKEIGTSDATYQFPPLELLKKGKAQTAERDDMIRQNAIKLQEVLKSFGVNVTMTNYSCGPSVTRYEMVPEQGVKVSKITGLADDIMMNLAAQSIRIEAPIPGKSAVGIEIPNGKRSPVGFRELIDTEKFIKHPSKIAVAVGKDIEGNVVVEDIAKMPHLLIAGATGSGKSVCTNTLIMSILYKARPEEVKLILVDPKQVELKVYNGIPHLLTPVVTDPKKAAGALNWAVAEMSKRYEMFAECNVRNIQGYNAKVEEIINSGRLEDETMEKMPQIVIIVDELADLMMVAKAEVEEAIVRLAQLARAAGIHLVIATQRPSVDIVTGLIKANVPSRIALSVSSGVDSRTIIDSVGAEKLLGNGDMLFYPTMYPKPVRVQGAYISDDEVVEVVEFLKAQNGETSYSEEVTSQIDSSSSGGAVAIGNGSSGNEQDEYFVQAGRFIIEKNKASIGMLQRMFKIGFNRAARIMDQLSDAGVVGPEEGTKPRQVLMSEEQFEEYIDEYF